MANANNLLAMSTPAMIAVIVVSVLCALFLVLGVFRKFSRASWLGYQLAALFGVSLLLDLFPATDGIWYPLIVGGSFFGAEALLLGAGAIVRYAIRARKEQAHIFWRVADRILGALTYLVNFAVALLICGMLAATVMLNILPSAPEFIAPLGELEIWQSYGRYCADFLLIVFLKLAVKAGYKLGASKRAWVGLALVLTLAALLGSVVLVGKLSFLTALSDKIAGTVSQDHSVLSRIVGHAVTSLVVFVALFIVIVVLTLLFNLLVKYMQESAAFKVMNGMLLALLFYAVALAVALFAYYGLDKILGLIQTQDIVSGTEGYILRLMDLFARAPFTSVFYGYNPFFA